MLNSIYFYIRLITAPIQIQHGTTDEEVPYVLSQKLNSALESAGKTSIFYSYEGDNHNLSNNLDIALKRSVEFFDTYLKNNSTLPLMLVLLSITLG